MLAHLAPGGTLIEPGVLPDLVDAVLAEWERVHAVVRGGRVQAHERICMQPMTARGLLAVDDDHVDIGLGYEHVGERKPARPGPHDQVVGVHGRLWLLIGADISATIRRGASRLATSLRGHAALGPMSGYSSSSPRGEAYWTGGRSPSLPDTDPGPHYPGGWGGRLRARYARGGERGVAAIADRESGVWHA